MSRGQTRKMATAKQIRAYWLHEPSDRRVIEHLAEIGAALCPKDDDRAYGLPPVFCFACGLGWPVERAHIVAKAAGGSDGAENLHLLCRLCHAASELRSGPAYWAWLKSRDGLVAAREYANQVGISLEKVEALPPDKGLLVLAALRTMDRRSDQSSHDALYGTLTELAENGADVRTW